MHIIAADTKYIVVGLGVTGLSCVRYLVCAGKQVAVCDSRENPPGLDILREEFPNIAVHVGSFDVDLLSSADFLVMSPGIALATPEIQAAIEAGVSITSDVELFLNAFKGKVVAITGSNAKSTVTAWLGLAIANAGVSVLVAGNIGVPVLSGLDKQYDIAVLELSSFQLELVKSLQADVATILNVSEDHLDRYDSFAAYQQAKQRIYFGCKQAVFNRHDVLTQPLLPATTAVTSFALSAPDLKTYGLLQDNAVTYLARGFEKILEVGRVSLAGQHNIENALAVLALSDSLDIPREATVNALTTFVGLKHRCQLVCDVNGVRYFNDSKATNVGSTLAAVQGLSDPVKKNIILLLGGQSKGQDLLPLKLVLEKSCKAILVYGQDAHLFQALDARAEQFDTLGQALSRANTIAASDDVVLLSPACASFDQYKNFEARGDAFVHWLEEHL